MGNGTLQRAWKNVKMAEPDFAESDLSAQEFFEPSGTFIGSGALFEGTLKLRGNFQIDSEFRGELRTDGKVVVGRSGSVVGGIHASDVEIFGAVVGDISARRELILHAGSRLHGGITTACLEIERHAFFSGTTAMTEPQTLSRRQSRDASAVSSTPIGGAESARA